MNIDKAAVYRKAAEIIVRDGQAKGGLTGNGYGFRSPGISSRLKDHSIPVCALGACARAEWELYQTLPEDPYKVYDFSVEHDGRPRDIWIINDLEETSAEDVALALKRHAEGIDV